MKQMINLFFKLILKRNIILT